MLSLIVLRVISGPFDMFPLMTTTLMAILSARNPVTADLGLQFPRVVIIYIYIFIAESKSSHASFANKNFHSFIYLPLRVVGPLNLSMEIFRAYGSSHIVEVGYHLSRMHRSKHYY